MIECCRKYWCSLLTNYINLYSTSNMSIYQKIQQVESNWFIFLNSHSQVSYIGRNRTNCLNCANWDSFVYDNWQQWRKGLLDIWSAFSCPSPQKESYWNISSLGEEDRICLSKNIKKSSWQPQLFRTFFLNSHDSNPSSHCLSYFLSTFQAIHVFLFPHPLHLFTLLLSLPRLLQ